MNVEKPNVTYVDEMEVEVSGMVVKMDDEFLGYALNFTFDLLESLKTNFTGIHPIFIPPLTEEEEEKDMKASKGSHNPFVGLKL